MWKYAGKPTAHFGLTYLLLPGLYETNECEKEEKSQNV
jgi:hypothetical protein